jgi:hypothetical protein
MTLLGITVLQTSGQFVLFTFLSPLLAALGGALFAAGSLHLIGYAAVALLASALSVMVIATRERPVRRPA